MKKFLKTLKFNSKQNLILTIGIILAIYIGGKLLPILLPVAFFLIKVGLVYLTVVFGSAFIRQWKTAKRNRLSNPS